MNTTDESINEIGAETIQIILSHAKTWSLLLAYDEDRLNFPESGNNILATCSSSIHSILQKLDSVI